MPETKKLRTIPFDDQKAIADAIKNHENFEIGGCQNRMGDAVLFAERVIGSEGMASRVYTKGRAATLLVGVALPLAAIAAHNLATAYPDYEIIKRPIDKALLLIYVKDDPTITDHVSETYSKVASGASRAMNSAGEVWDEKVPSREQVLSTLFPYQIVSRKKSKDGNDSSPGGKDAVQIEVSDLDQAETAAKVIALQKRLDQAAERYKEQNKSNEFIICIFAVGAAMAACDGNFDHEEESALKEFVLGVSSTAVPNPIKVSLEKLVEQPPTFEQAILYVEKLDTAAWPLIDNILTVVSELDGVVSDEEIFFIEQWAAYKSLNATQSATNS